MYMYMYMYMYKFTDNNASRNCHRRCAKNFIKRIGMSKRGIAKKEKGIFEREKLLCKKLSKYLI